MTLVLDEKNSIAHWKLPISTRVLVENCTSGNEPSVYFSINGYLVNFNLSIFNVSTYRRIKKPIPELELNANYCLRINYDCSNGHIAIKLSDEKKSCKIDGWSITLDKISDFKSLNFEIKVTPDCDEDHKEKEYAFNLIKEGTLSNVIIEVEEKEYKCDKYTLGLRSNFFKKMFTSGITHSLGFSEANEKKIVLSTCSSFMFDVIVKYIYTMEIDHQTLQSEDLEKFMIELFQLANFFDMKSLISRVVDYFDITMCKSNIESRYSLLYKFPELEKLCAKHMSKMNPNTIPDSFLMKFYNIDEDKLATLKVMFNYEKHK